MDLHVMWLRARIIRRVTAKLAAVGGVLAAAIGVALWVGDAAGPATAALGGVGVAVCLAGCWLVFAMFTNPIDHRYLRAYLAEGVELQRPDQSPLVQDDGPGAPRLRYTLVDRTADTPVCSVYSAGRVIVSRSARTEKVVLYSRLVDGRTVVTDSQLTVPRAGVITNLCRGVDLSALADRHRDLLDRLASRGLLIDPAPDPQLVIEHLAAEREAFRQLGSIWGCFLAVDGRRSKADLTVDVEAQELLALHGLRPTAADEPRRVLAIEPVGTPSADPGVGRDGSLTRLGSPP